MPPLNYFALELGAELSKLRRGIRSKRFLIFEAKLTVRENSETRNYRFAMPHIRELGRCHDP